MNLFLFSCCMQVNLCEAQKKAPHQKGKWQLSAGAAVSQIYLTDQYFTSNIYSGINVGGSLAAKYSKPKSFHEISAFISGGSLKTTKGSSDLDNIYFNIDYVNMYTIGRSGKALKFCGGGGVDIMYAQRQFNNFVNNDYSFEFGVSLSGAFEISYLINNRFSFSDRIVVPFVSAIEQPGFGTEDPSGSDGTKKSVINSFFESARILSFSSFLRFKNSLDLNMSLSAKSRLALDYTWDYYRLSDIRNVKNVNHELRLIYSYIF